ncbi:Phosphohistidine phosphatase SixA [hydrothermal vent metagenome]|uniref:Phosphohistidine phosphatase SixA n=1 Tax=hydrothermal vent metagenome TaxID=652676 RepID=A0A3B0RGS8_9ZZZZ
MKTLLLIRHAKAANFGLETGDHSRPLSQKGREHAAILGQQITDAGIEIDQILVSSAQRTIETWQQIRADKPVDAIQIEKLYLASSDEIQKQIWLHADEAETLAIIGHNPGLAILSWELLQAGQNHDLSSAQKLQGNFKTAYAACFDMRQKQPKLCQVFDPRTG